MSDSTSVVVADSTHHASHAVHSKEPVPFYGFVFLMGLVALLVVTHPRSKSDI